MLEQLRIGFSEGRAANAEMPLATLAMLRCITEQTILKRDVVAALKTIKFCLSVFMCACRAVDKFVSQGSWAPQPASACPKAKSWVI